MRIRDAGQAEDHDLLPMDKEKKSAAPPGGRRSMTYNLVGRRLRLGRLS